MLDKDARQRVVQAVFAATGELLTEDDPCVVAALFYADTVRGAGAEAARSVHEAGQAAVAVLTEAGVGVRGAAQAAEAMMQAAAADRRVAAAERQALVTDIEKRVQQCLRQAIHKQSTGTPMRRSAMEVVATVAAGVVLLFCVEFVWFDYSVDWVHDVRIGRKFNRTVPTLDPDLRKRLIEHIQKGH